MNGDCQPKATQFGYPALNVGWLEACHDGILAVSPRTQH